MYDRPDPVEQLAAVADFLRDQVMPQVDGPLAFHLRVAANMLDIVSRQTRLAPQARPPNWRGCTPCSATGAASASMPT